MPSTPAAVLLTAAATASVAAIALLFSIRRASDQQYSKEDVWQLRCKYFSSSSSVSHANTGPLMILEGNGTTLIDSSGTAYLDTRNNVAHCGHNHARVSRAIQQQMGRLTTNTRYLHPVTCELAERLVESLPDSLDTVFFVNSGSEANDLALRLASIWANGSRNTVVVNNGYHGHSLAVLEVSSCKFTKSAEYSLEKPAPGAEFATPGPHIWRVSCPDVYRGKYRDPDTAGALYANEVQVACDHYKAKGEKVRAFIAESVISVGGAIQPPRGYLSACAKTVREAGGLYIADEVQTGFGRLGTCYWGFQYHDGDSLVPDIVTVGKAFGNGTPIAAVITSKKVAAAFEDQQVEYFNTFGGNPVSTTAGLTVMNVIRDEKLQENARIIGDYLIEGLLSLKEIVHLIGDVRGSGFSLGVEFVRDRSTLEPATAETNWLCSHMKDRYHILTSIDGELQNILNVKPPMVFSRADADRFLSCLRQALTIDITQVDLSGVSATPT